MTFAEAWKRARGGWVRKEGTDIEITWDDDAQTWLDRDGKGYPVGPCGIVYGEWEPMIEEAAGKPPEVVAAVSLTCPCGRKIITKVTEEGT